MKYKVIGRIVDDSFNGEPSETIGYVVLDENGEVHNSSVKKIKTLYQQHKLTNVMFQNDKLITTNASTSLIPVFNQVGRGTGSNAAVILGVYKAAEPFYKVLLPLGSIKIMTRKELLQGLQVSGVKLFNARIKNNQIVPKEGQFPDLTNELPKYAEQPKVVGEVSVADNDNVVLTKQGNIVYAAASKAAADVSALITIPDGVDIIADNAFLHCSKIYGVLLPNTVKRIGKSAFFGCTALYCFSIPDSVKQIDNHAFAGGSYYIHAPSHLYNRLFTEYGDRVILKKPKEYYNDSRNLFTCENIEATEDTEDTEDTTVAHGANYAFVPKANIDFTMITELTLSAELDTYLSLNYFFNLRRLTISEGVKYIYCNEISLSRLTTVSVPDSLKHLQGFEKSPWMTNKLREYDGIGCYINNTLYYVAPKTDTYEVRRGTQNVVMSAFSNKALKTMILPDTIQRLDLTTALPSYVNIFAPASTVALLREQGITFVKEIRGTADVAQATADLFIIKEQNGVKTAIVNTELPVTQLSKITEVSTPAGCAYVQGLANLVNLVKLVVAEGTIQIDACGDKITSVTLPESIRHIGTALDNTPWLKSVFRNVAALYIKDKLLRYNPNAVKGAYQVKAGTKFIGNEAFAYTSIEEVHIPQTVVNIGVHLFRGCKELKIVWIACTTVDVRHLLSETNTVEAIYVQPELYGQWKSDAVYGDKIKPINKSIRKAENTVELLEPIIIEGKQTGYVVELPSGKVKRLQTAVIVDKLLGELGLVLRNGFISNGEVIKY